MFKARLTVRKLMVTVAVLAAGMFGVQCYRTWDSAHQRIEVVRENIMLLEGTIRNYRENFSVLGGTEESINAIRELEETLRKLKLLDVRLEHVLRHPWHGLPIEGEAN